MGVPGQVESHQGSPKDDAGCSLEFGVSLLLGMVAQRGSDGLRFSAYHRPSPDPCPATWATAAAYLRLAARLSHFSASLGSAATPSPSR